MRTAGITQGCNAAGTGYCPEGNVTRQQMAAFLHRLAVSHVVDAATLNSRPSTDFVGDADWREDTEAFLDVAPGYQVVHEVACPLGQRVIGGGGESREISSGWQAAHSITRSNGGRLDQHRCELNQSDCHGMGHGRRPGFFLPLEPGP